MPFVAAILKWCAENPKTLRYGLMALGVLAIAGWLYHRGASSEAAHETAREVSTVIAVKDQYDEISNHRPDDLSLLDLLQRGAF